MFGLGLSEIFTIFIVIIVVLNPKDLPIIVRKVGKTYAKIMQQLNQIKKSYQKFEEDLKIEELNNIEVTKTQFRNKNKKIL
jgi:Tat protein translocase TatB subunit